MWRKSTTRWFRLPREHSTAQLCYDGGDFSGVHTYAIPQVPRSDCCPGRSVDSTVSVAGATTGRNPGVGAETGQGQWVGCAEQAPLETSRIAGRTQGRRIVEGNRGQRQSSSGGLYPDGCRHQDSATVPAG